MGKKTARAIYCLLLIIVLSAFLFFLSTRLNKSLMREIQALATYNKALAQLSLDEGSTLKRLSINVEMR